MEIKEMKDITKSVLMTSLKRYVIKGGAIILFTVFTSLFMDFFIFCLGYGSNIPYIFSQTVILILAFTMIFKNNDYFLIYYRGIKTALMANKVIKEYESIAPNEEIKKDIEDVMNDLIDFKITLDML